MYAIALTALLAAAPASATEPNPLPRMDGTVTMAPATVADASDLEIALAIDRFERGSDKVRQAKQHAWAGVAVCGAGTLAAGAGLVSAMNGGGESSIALTFAGMGAAATGAGLMIVAPFEMNNGLRGQRDGLQRLGVDADRRNARAAAATGLGGAAMALALPPVGMAGYASGMGFSSAQARTNERVLQEVMVSPTFRKGNPGLQVSGRF